MNGGNTAKEDLTAILSNNSSILCIASTLLAAIFRVKYFACERDIGDEDSASRKREVNELDWWNPSNDWNFRLNFQLLQIE